MPALMRRSFSSSVSLSSYFHASGILRHAAYISTFFDSSTPIARKTPHAIMQSPGNAMCTPSTVSLLPGVLSAARMRPSSACMSALRSASGRERRFASALSQSLYWTSIVFCLLDASSRIIVAVRTITLMPAAAHLSKISEQLRL